MSIRAFNRVDIDRIEHVFECIRHLLSSRVGYLLCFHSVLVRTQEKTADAEHFVQERQSKHSV